MECFDELVGLDIRIDVGQEIPGISARGVSGRTVQRDWEKARLFLYRTAQKDTEERTTL